MYKTAFTLLGIFLTMTSTLAADKDAPAKPDRIYELRVYHAAPSKIKELDARFRDHTCKLFEKHGMTLVGFWHPEGKEADEKLIYILAHDSREAAKKSWEAFQNDPDWKKAKAESEKDGTLVQKVDVTWLNPTDYSKLK